LRPLAPDGRTGPALVARAQAPDGASIGVHITWLAHGGTGKDPEAARKMLGAGFSGASVRLGDGPDVVVAEGIESALSAAHALGLSPVAALSAGGVAAWRPWPGVRGIMFAPDRDPSGVGERAARGAADRLHRAGWTIHGFALPPAPFCDWNDAARAAGKGGAS
jgi:putative DNA primase/helicase